MHFDVQLKRGYSSSSYSTSGNYNVNGAAQAAAAAQVK